MSASVSEVSRSPAPSRYPDRLPPGGILTQSAGVATFLDGAAWLPVGSDQIRVDANGKPLSTDTYLARIDPSTGAITARVPISGAGAWTFAVGSSIVVQIETGSGGSDVVSTKTLRRERRIPGASAFGLGSLWDIVSDPKNGNRSLLIRIDPQSGKITTRTSIQVDPSEYFPAVTVGAGSLWVGAGDASTVIRIDPKTMRSVGTVRLDDVHSEMFMGFGYGAVWALQLLVGAGKLYRIDPATNAVTATAALGDAAGPSQSTLSNLAFGDGSVWACDGSSNLTEVDAASGAVKSIRDVPFDDCYWVSVGAGSVWVAGGRSGGATDPQTIRFELK